MAYTVIAYDLVPQVFGTYSEALSVIPLYFLTRIGSFILYQSFYLVYSTLQTAQMAVPSKTT
jgi:hypothetical protein